MRFSRLNDVLNGISESYCELHTCTMRASVNIHLIQRIVSILNSNKKLNGNNRSFMYYTVHLCIEYSFEHIIISLAETSVVLVL